MTIQCLSLILSDLFKMALPYQCDSPAACQRIINRLNQEQGDFLGGPAQMITLKNSGLKYVFSLALRSALKQRDSGGKKKLQAWACWLQKGLCTELTLGWPSGPGAT